MNGRFQMQGGKTGFCRKISMQTGSSETLIGWKSGQTTFVPLWDQMEGSWLWTQCRELFSYVVVFARSYVRRENSHRYVDSTERKTVENVANRMLCIFFSGCVLFLELSHGLYQPYNGLYKTSVSASLLRAPKSVSQPL
jgi:hypothetical protein